MGPAIRGTCTKPFQKRQSSGDTIVSYKLVDLGIKESLLTHMNIDKFESNLKCNWDPKEP